MSIFKINKRLKSGWLTALCVTLCSSGLAVDLNFTPNFKLDQQSPQAAFGSTGGVVIWQDLQSASGNFSIKGIKLNSNLVAENGVFFISDENADGYQENAKAAAIHGGGFAYAWQGGQDARQSIFLRIQGQDGVFKGSSIPVTSTSGYHSNPSVAAGGDNIIVVWETYSGSEETGFDVFGKIFNGDGEAQSPVFRISRKLSGNQKVPVAAHAGGGSFTVIWVDDSANTNPNEEVPGAHTVRLAAKSISSFRDALELDSYLTSAGEIAANPSACFSGTGNVHVTYSTKSQKDAQSHWGIKALTLDSNLNIRSSTSVGNSVDSDLLAPSVTCFNSRPAVAYMAESGGDTGYEIYADYLDGNGAIQINTANVGHQMHPAIASIDGVSSAIVVWGGFNSVSSGFDIFGKVIRAQGDIPAAPSVFAYALSSSDISASAIIPISQTGSSFEFEYSVGGGDSTVITSDSPVVSIGNLSPGSEVSVRSRYTNASGAVSEWSESVSSSSWGADSNFDGLPDDWQKSYFGNDLSAQPRQSISAYFDFDNDGASNLSEFLAGTDPSNSASVLKLSITIGDNLSIQWNTVPGGSYFLEGSSNLESWSKIGGSRLAADSVDSVVLSTLEAATYFRVIKVR